MKFLDNTSAVFNRYDARFNEVVLHYVEGKFVIAIECKDENTKEALTKKATELLEQDMNL
jgi:hypothetical protein